MDKRKCRVGICDDRQEDIRLIEDALRKGIKRIGQAVSLLVSSFQNGEDLYAAVCKAEFDLIFLDIEMPGMDGFELASVVCT